MLFRSFLFFFFFKGKQIKKKKISGQGVLGNTLPSTWHRHWVYHSCPHGGAGVITQSITYACCVRTPLDFALVCAERVPELI